MIEAAIIETMVAQPVGEGSGGAGVPSKVVAWPRQGKAMVRPGEESSGGGLGGNGGGMGWRGWCGRTIEGGGVATALAQPGGWWWQHGWWLARGGW